MFHLPVEKRENSYQLPTLLIPLSQAYTRPSLTVCPQTCKVCFPLGSHCVCVLNAMCKPSLNLDVRFSFFDQVHNDSVVGRTEGLLIFSCSWTMAFLHSSTLHLHVNSDHSVLEWPLENPPCRCMVFRGQF